MPLSSTKADGFERYLPPSGLLRLARLAALPPGISESDQKAAPSGLSCCQGPLGERDEATLTVSVMMLQSGSSGRR